jgi:hypothetical protein
MQEFATMFQHPKARWVQLGGYTSAPNFIHHIIGFIQLIAIPVDSDFLLKVENLHPTIEVCY